MKVTIKEWNSVATWRWDIPEDDVCGICQVHFDGTCPTCKYPGDDCSLREPASLRVHVSSQQGRIANGMPSLWQVRTQLSHGRVPLPLAGGLLLMVPDSIASWNGSSKTLLAANAPCVASVREPLFTSPWTNS